MSDLLERLEKFIEQTKNAAEQDPPTSHPVGKKDPNVMKPAEGERAKENTRDVKETVETGGVDAAPKQEDKTDKGQATTDVTSGEQKAPISSSTDREDDTNHPANMKNTNPGPSGEKKAMAATGADLLARLRQIGQIPTTKEAEVKDATVIKDAEEGKIASIAEEDATNVLDFLKGQAVAEFLNKMAADEAAAAGGEGPASDAEVEQAVSELVDELEQAGVPPEEVVKALTEEAGGVGGAPAEATGGGEGGGDVDAAIESAVSELEQAGVPVDAIAEALMSEGNELETEPEVENKEKGEEEIKSGSEEMDPLLQALILSKLLE